MDGQNVKYITLHINPVPYGTGFLFSNPTRRVG